MTYQAVFKSGNAKVVVMFTDGSMTASGKRPATFTTDSLWLQHIIENSDEFKKGFIYRYRNLVLNEEVELEKNPEGCKCRVPSAECREPSGGCREPRAKCREEEVEVEVEPSDEGQVPSAEGQVTSAEGQVTSADGEEQEEEIVKVFSFNDEAKDFLEDTFGIDRNKIKTRPEIIKAGAENGVTIKFKN